MPISEETRNAILEATWALIAKRKRLDVGQAEIAAAAGVSRQTVYLAFGNRAGLLTAMVRHRDTQSDHVARLSEISHGPNVSLDDFQDYLDIWIDYLQLIYPVAILLDAAALTDADAESAWDDRMKGALLAGLKRIFMHLATSRQLKPEWTIEQASQLTWSLLHPACVRQLMVGCGWSAAEFRRSRMDLIRATLLNGGKTRSRS